MRSIFKYKIPKLGPGESILHVPAGAQLLHFGEDPQGHICIWAAVNPNETQVELPVDIAFTGRDVACDGQDTEIPWRHLGSCLLRHEPIVLHCFVQWSV